MDFTEFSNIVSESTQFNNSFSDVLRQSIYECLDIAESSIKEIDIDAICNAYEEYPLSSYLIEHHYDDIVNNYAVDLRTDENLICIKDNSVLRYK